MNIQKTLLRREFWENRGGFLWAPMVAACLFVLLALVGMVGGSMLAHQADVQHTLVFEGRHVSSVELGQILSNLPAHQVAEVGKAIDMSLWVSAVWPFAVLAFVAFFYCLSCLYDERKDRSILFWKSMPVSDGATVLSKALSALVVAPAVAALIGGASMLLFFASMSIWVAFHGADHLFLLRATNPLGVLVQLLGALPVYALWALPTAGWLMLCSALSRSKPFLWAILLPLMTGIAISMLDNGSAGWVWSIMVPRLLLGFVPGTWLSVANQEGFAFGLSTTYSVLATPSLWIGAAVGIGMLFLAANIRRWKDEG